MATGAKTPFLALLHASAQARRAPPRARRLSRSERTPYLYRRFLPLPRRRLSPSQTSVTNTPFFQIGPISLR